MGAEKDDLASLARELAEKKLVMILLMRGTEAFTRNWSCRLT